MYEDYQMIQLTQPYIPGFLAFREMDFMIQLYKNVKENNTQYTPQVSTGCLDTLLNKCVRRSKFCIIEKFYGIYFNFLGEGVSEEQTDGSPVKYM